jgi:hypothetical protein
MANAKDECDNDLDRNNNSNMFKKILPTSDDIFHLPEFCSK